MDQENTHSWCMRLWFVVDIKELVCPGQDGIDLLVSLVSLGIPFLTEL